MNKRSVLIPLITAVFLWIPSQGFSQNAGPKHKMWDDLQLTADQKTKIASMHQSGQDIRKKYHEEAVAVRTKIRDELSKPNPSKSVLNEYVNELSSIHTKQTQGLIDHLLQLKQILTPEQFQKIMSKQWTGDPEKGNFGYRGNRKFGDCKNPNCPKQDNNNSNSQPDNPSQAQ